MQENSFLLYKKPFNFPEASNFPNSHLGELFDIERTADFDEFQTRTALVGD